ncbi:hypothetical protein llap_11522 [Limosa lapponica baueri]|uniref:Complex I assembly factor TIMMDC1, mitochondrial n=1 Tax=Limosa lapponica baueri TaxID=1758121 RepID=A0A2I0TWK1_LIMLA|nr:hypothetical protein llap_11522 [Limosa lapponica baueri]
MICNPSPLFPPQQSAHRAGLRSFIRYGWRWSWRVAAFVTIFKIPAGGLLMLMQKLAGETLQEKRNRERRELYERKLAEWQSRLSVMEVLGQMENDAQEGLETEGARESRSY